MSDLADGTQTATATLTFRRPGAADAAGIHALVRASGRLDLNSRYLYLLLCTHFAPTCVVAHDGAQVVGFVSAYRPPTAPGTLFVWQVAVDAGQRGRGVAARMLDEMLARDACAGVYYLEATVGPTNQASRALFASLARRRGAPLHEQPGFPPELFAPEAHEDEVLLRIGPFESV